MAVVVDWPFPTVRPFLTVRSFPTVSPSRPNVVVLAPTAANNNTVTVSRCGRAPFAPDHQGADPTHTRDSWNSVGPYMYAYIINHRGAKQGRREPDSARPQKYHSSHYYYYYVDV